MMKLYRLAKEQFHELYALFFFALMLGRPFSAFYLVFADVENSEFKVFLALAESFCAFLLLKGKRVGVYLLALSLFAELLLTPNFSDTRTLISIFISIFLISVFLFVLKKNGQTAWSVLR